MRWEAFGSFCNLFRKFVEVFQFLEVFVASGTYFDLFVSARMRSDASGSVRTVASVPYTGEAPGAENLRNPRNVRSQGLT